MSPTRHLGMQVSAYVDRRLDAAVLRAFDQHLVACQVCRFAADEERRLLASLRGGSTPGLSEGLQSVLLGLGSPTRPGSPAGVPEAPAAVRAMRLRTVPPTAPARHRSPVRSAVLAGLAAGASAAAAWSLTVSGTPSSPPVGPAVARIPGPASVTPVSSAVTPAWPTAGFLNAGLSGETPIRQVPASSTP